MDNEIGTSAKDFMQLAQDFGISVEGMNLPGAVENTGSTSFLYQHKVGEYVGLIGRILTKYKDRDQKPCEATVAGATISHAIQQILIVKDEKQIILSDFSLLPDTEYGRFVYNQYITRDSDRQWQNARFYEKIAYTNAPILIVTGDIKKGDFIVNLNNAVFFYGAPVKFKLKETTKGSIYVDSIELIDTVIDKAKMTNRKNVMDALYKKLEDKLDAEKKEREARRAAKNADNKNEAVPQRNGGEAESADSLLSEFGL